MKKEIQGIPASPGISIGKAFVYKELNLNVKKDTLKTEEDIKKNISKLKEGQSKTKKQLLRIKEITKKKLGDSKAEIFDGHITLLEDEELTSEVIEKIESQKINASYALRQGINEYCEIISNLDDPYLRERAADLLDISKRWIANIKGIKIPSLSNLEKNTIIIANDLTPSDTAQIDLNNVLGFVTEIGGKTAHSSIMARSLELPAVVGTGDILNYVKQDQTIILDAIDGKIILDPDDQTISKYRLKQKRYFEEKKELEKIKTKKAITLDDKVINLWGNIGKPRDVEGVLKNGAEGIGLYRTEFLFMDNDKFPTEEEQFQAYKEVLEKMKGKPVTIRTMDIGGDKDLAYMNLPKEMNPFLGWRAIRISLKETEVFKTQLRALLRASAYGKLKIMFPMIISSSEITEAKNLLEECKKELKHKNIQFDEKIQVGIMVETPAVAFRAKHIAKEVDFFSIGTNDLTQYILATDRGNENISHLYTSFNPAVLEAIYMIIKGAHSAGIKVSMCGEFAGNPKATAVLLGMGLDSFSMCGISIPRIKKQIMNLSKKECSKLIPELLNQNTTEDVLDYIENNF